MIYVIGDSHAKGSFQGVPGVASFTVGPVTMYRASRPGDWEIPNAVKLIKPQQGDVVLLHFGEIDMRAHTHHHIPLADSEQMTVLINDYVAKAASTSVGEARIGIASIIPPVSRERSPTAEGFCLKDIPDAVRAVYTARANELLALGCTAQGLLYVDLYREYVGADGMMLAELAEDAGIHIRDTSRVHELLRRMGLLDEDDPPWRVLPGSQ